MEKREVDVKQLKADNERLTMENNKLKQMLGEEKRSCKTCLHNYGQRMCDMEITCIEGWLPANFYCSLYKERR